MRGVQTAQTLSKTTCGWGALRFLAAALLFWVSAIPIATAGAQDGDAVQNCNQTALDIDPASPRFPDIRGCPAAYARRIHQRLGNRFVVRSSPVEITGVRTGTIVTQVEDGRQVVFGIARAPTAPVEPAAPAAPEPAVVPPGGLIAAPLPAQQVSFSISDAPGVFAGEPLVFEVRRSGNDGLAHEFGISVLPPQAVIDPPKSMRFEPGDPDSKPLTLRTSATGPNGGDRPVQVLLIPGNDGATIGVPRAASGIVSEAPAVLPQQSVFSIRPGPARPRNEDVTFIVSRSGPLKATRLAYRVEESSDVSMDATPALVDFAEGADTAVLTVPARPTSRCGDAPAVVLEDGRGTTARGSFTDAQPADCFSGPPDNDWEEILIVLEDSWPFVLGGFTLFTLIALERYYRPFIRARSSCTIESGTVAIKMLGGPAGQWPQISPDVEIVPGGLRVTQPLLRGERSSA